MPPWEKYQSVTPSAAGGQPWLKYTKSEPKQQIPQSVARTALDQGLQGGTFGFADEVTDRIGAGIASLATGEGYNDLLKEARGMSKERLQQQMEQNPVTSIASNLAGGLLTGGAGATTKAGGTVANSLRTGNTAARIAKGAAAGAVSGGLYGAGAAEEGNRIEGAGRGAVLGGAVGAAVPAIGAGLSATGKGIKNTVIGATARDADELADAAAKIKQSSNQAYQAMRQSGAVINRPRVVNISNKVEQAIASTGKLNKSLHGNTLSVLDDFKQAARNGDFTIEELDQYRQLFRDVINKGTDVAGKIDPDAFKASKAIEMIDDLVDDLKPIDLRGGNTQAIDALKLGRSEYARARKFEAISDIINKSGGDANKLKRDLTSLMNNPKKLRGFNAAEREALKQAANQTTGEGLMKMVGKFGFDIGSGRSIGNTALPVLGALGTGIGAGTGAGAVVPVVGTAARQGQKYLARGKAENLLKVIEQGSANAASNSKAISPLLSAPAGAAGGAISGAESQAPKMVAPVPVTNPASKYSKPEQQSSLQNSHSQETLEGGALLDTIKDPRQKAKAKGVVNHIATAAKIAGVSPQYMLKKARLESSLNPNAAAKTSSAKGLYQFTKATWNDMVKRHGKQYGITEKDILNPRANAIMAGLFTKENKATLEKNLGRKASETELYLAHFLGADGATTLLDMKDNYTPAAKVMPAAAKANKSIFFTGEGRARTPLGVIKVIERKLAKA